MNWFLWSGAAILYLVLVFTLCMMTFRKGHTVLGWVGIIFPVLWFVGAIMPPTDAAAASYQGRY
jgi:hypothetical protein